MSKTDEEEGEWDTPASVELQITYLKQFLREVELQIPKPQSDGKAPQNPPAKLH